MTDGSSPLISIVIPTRERAAKLLYTLKTVLSQSSGDFEVVVSDNASADGTRAVVEKFQTDPRLRYFNTGRRLSMCDNWEFGVGQARGRYIMVIGDDDALADGAIPQLEDLIRRNSSEIYFWDPHVYQWPCERQGASLLYRAPCSSTREVELGDLTRFAFRWGGLGYQRLPLLYHSLVSRDVLRRIRLEIGRLFHSTQPDVFIAFTLPVFCRKALRIGESLSVYGNSEKRVYGQRALDDPGSALGNKIKRFVDEYGDYKLHPSLYPGVPFWVNMIPDAMLVARDFFPDYYRARPFDYDAMWAFFWRYWRFESMFAIAARRREIRAYHPFHLRRYSMFLALHLLSEGRMALRRLFRVGPSRYETEPCPENIAEFVRAMSARREPA